MWILKGDNIRSEILSNLICLLLWDIIIVGKYINAKLYSPDVNM